jgi:hypothetical protein
MHQGSIHRAAELARVWFSDEEFERDILALMGKPMRVYEYYNDSKPGSQDQVALKGFIVRQRRKR